MPRVDPNLLKDFNMATNGNGDDAPPAGGGDLPVLDLRTMEDLCQPTLNGQTRPITPISIQHLDKFLHGTQSIKVNGVTDDALRLYLFPHSLKHHATAWVDRLPRNSITTFEQMAKMFLRKYFPPSMVTKLRNEITNFRQRPNESLFEAWEHYKLLIDHFPNHNMLPVTQINTFYNGLTLGHRDTINAAAGGTFMKRPLKAEMAEINKDLMKVLQINQQVKAVTHSCETCGGPHSYNDCLTTVGQTQNVYAAGAYNQGGNSYQPQGNRNLLSYRSDNYLRPPGNSPSNTITNPKEDLKGITTRSGIAYKGPKIPTTSSPPKVVERETEVTKDTVPPTNNGIIEDVQTSVVQIETQVPNSDPVVVPVVVLVVEPVKAPVSALKPNPKLAIPYPSRHHDQNLRDKANDQKEKFFQIFQDLNFNISFADALILMPMFGPTIKSLLTNKEKLFELARTPLNKYCSAVLLKNLPEKLGDPVVDFDADPRVSLILRRSVLKTRRALIDVYEGELTFHVGKEAVAFNLDQTSRYFANYDAESINRIDVIDVACEDYPQEALGFSMSGNPTPATEPIVSISSPTLMPFEDTDFLLEETNAFLAIEDEPISPEINDSFYDSEGDILLLKELLNDDSSSPPLPS
nr:reverse transcriptase domain-containing protein [Tanacetum cinerariifolium]